jgi:subtilisin
VDKAYEEGILIVAAAGNKGTKGVQYPGKFASVIAVGAVDPTNMRISVSSIGPEVEFAAPGYGIYSTVPTYPNDLGETDYGYLTGTSMAAPFVTGVAALYLEKYPYYSNIQIRNLLQKNALDIGTPGRDNFYGYGVVQVDQTPTLPDDVNIVYETNSKGAITLDMLPILEKYDGYNLFRENQLLVENSTASMVTDYGTKGVISYTIYPTVNGVVQKGKEIYLNINLSYPAFIDLSNNQWYSRQLVFLYSKDILRGYDGSFIKPNRFVTRAEAVSMLGRALNLSGTQRTTRFSDVPSHSFASGYIESAAKAGILTGHADGTFRPNEPVSRAEMAILISKGFSLSQSQTLSFSDVNSSIAGYQEISNLAVAGITQGYQDGTFRPQDKMNRATFAVFLARALNPNFR